MAVETRRLTNRAAMETVWDAGFRAAALYPGRRNMKWSLVCRSEDCRRRYTLTLGVIDDGFRCLHRSARSQQTSPHYNALSIVDEAGYEPLSLYPGDKYALWAVECRFCRRFDKVTLDQVAAGGKRCDHGREPVAAEVWA